MTTVGENRNERGVALLIALLVMTLLMALVMEFAYGTRVSMRAAANFRDGRRAAHLARSGVNVAGKILAELLRNNRPQDSLEQREWQIVPVMTGDDTELRVRWEDEAGKVSIASLASLSWPISSTSVLNSLLSSRARRSSPLRQWSTPSARRRSATWRLRRDSPRR